MHYKRERERETTHTHTHKQKRWRKDGNLPWKRHSYRSYWTIGANKRSASSIRLKTWTVENHKQPPKKKKKRTRNLEKPKNKRKKRNEIREEKRKRRRYWQGNLSSRGSMLRRSPVLISSNKLKGSIRKIKSPPPEKGTKNTKKSVYLFVCLCETRREEKSEEIRWLEREEKKTGAERSRERESQNEMLKMMINQSYDDFDEHNYLRICFPFFFFFLFLFFPLTEYVFYFFYF